jgi:hypothetical protein
MRSMNFKIPFKNFRFSSRSLSSNESDFFMPLMHARRGILLFAVMVIVGFSSKLPYPTGFALGVGEKLTVNQ